MERPLDTDVDIETPEHIVFHYRVAGPARRATANAVDLLLCYGTVAIVGFLIFVGVLGSSPGVGSFSALGKAGSGMFLLLLFAAQWLYFLAWEGKVGRSPGKMLVGIRVVTVDGRPIGFREAALRNLLRAADLLPMAYAVGLGSMIVTRRFQRLGDVVAGTMVVVPERAVASKPIALAPPASPVELAALPKDVVLDVDERTAIELFLRREGTLGAGRRHELATMIAGTLGRRFDVRHPDPARLLALLYDRAMDAGRSNAGSAAFGAPASAPPHRSHPGN